MADRALSHSELCHLAGRWLRSAHRCCVVAVEPRSYKISEQPDAIGWQTTGTSVLVEVKTSRADFFRDQDKPCRRSGHRLGAERWYLTPAYLVRADEVPVGWGLAEFRGDRIRRIVPATRVPGEPTQLYDELRLLLSLVQGERKARGVDMALPARGISGREFLELVAKLPAGTFDAFDEANADDDQADP